MLDAPYQNDQAQQHEDEDPMLQGLDAGVSDETDPLLEAMLWVCKHHGIERTKVSLLNGVSLSGPMGAKQAVSLLQDAGFNAAIVRRPPSKILSMLMPVILLLRNGDACIVTRRVSTRSKRAGGARYEVIMPGGNDQVCTATEEELLPEYSGFALLATPRSGTKHMMSKESHIAPPHWLWGTIKRYSPYYRASMLAALLSNMLMLMTGLFTRTVYDTIIPNSAMATLWSLGIGVLVAIGFDLAARQVRSKLIDLAGKKSDQALGNIIYRQALGIRLEHRPDSSGHFAHKLSQVEVVREFLTSASASVVTDLPFILLFMFMTWLVAGQLVLVLMIAVPTILSMSWAVQKVLKKLMKASMSQHADIHGLLIESVEGLEDLRAAGAQGLFLSRYEEAIAASAKTSLRARSMGALTNNLSMVSQQLVTVIMLIWGVHLIQEKLLTAGALIAGVMFATRTLAPLNSVVGLAGRFQGARAALASLDELMALPLERDAGKRYLSQPEVKGQIGLHDVQFAYPKGDQDHAPTVLKGVNLVIRPGERVAILGKIGSGKSTILRLLSGLYQPTDGFAELDGLDLRQVDIADFRRHVGFVSQEPKLFQGSLKENVLLGRVHANPAYFLEVARLTGLDRIAAAHPLGYDMPVGQAGTLLSGGQRQLVALARCLVTQPQILLLDEPTSSMDAQAESSFIQHLKTAVGQRTLVVVTHRPALLDVVDRIIVVEAGRVLADGPKAQVLALLAGQRPPPPAPPMKVVDSAPPKSVSAEELEREFAAAS
ncbi:MAG TPA: type I secretion system permease/ATPase [Aquabacterium sp.]|nr:type I secretion system permease/ATPase [Aquabacterium sp.]